MSEHSTGPDIDPVLKARLIEITDPTYSDPARKDFTGVDWLAFIGFFVVCAVGFIVWGY